MRRMAKIILRLLAVIAAAFIIRRIAGTETLVGIGMLIGIAVFIAISEQVDD